MRPLQAEAFQSHVKQLRRRYSSEKVEHMLASLGIEMGRERAAYFSDTEYAAALLDTRPEAIDELLSRPPSASTVLPNSSEAVRTSSTAIRRATSARDRLSVWLPFLGGLLLLAAVAIAAHVAP